MYHICFLSHSIRNILMVLFQYFFFFSSRRRHTRLVSDWSSDACSSDLEAHGAPAGTLVLVHDMSFVARRSAETRKYLFYFFVALGAIVALITVVIAQLSWRGWVHGLRALLRGEGLVRPSDGREAREIPELRPIASDLRALIRDLEADHRSSDEEPLAWTPETLRAILRTDLPGHEVMVVSNREPYIHVRQGDSIALWRPASGLVTAMEPIMRAARARGLHTVAAPPIARWWTSMPAWPCRRSSR